MEKFKVICKDRKGCVEDHERAFIALKARSLMSMNKRLELVLEAIKTASKTDHSSD